MRVVVRVGLALGILASAGARASFAEDPKLKPRGTQPSRCAEIEALGPNFAPLAKVCQFVSSPSTLPNFTCTEKTQSFSHEPRSKYQHAFETFTAEVTFDHDTQSYSDVAINGHPKSFLKKPHTADELYLYFLEHPDEQRNITFWSHFGEELSTVFARQNNTTFEYRGEAVIAGSNLEVFSFQIKKRTDKKERDKEERPLGFGTLWGGPSTYVGAKGLIWIDKPTSVVRRIVFHYTDIDRDYPYVAIADSTNYTLVPIAGLGKFVLPVAGENLSCDRDGFCWRDVYGFSNCRKFAAQSRILPAQ